MKFIAAACAFVMLAGFSTAGSIHAQSDAAYEYRTHFDHLEWSVRNYSKNIKNKESLRAAAELREEGNRLYLSKDYHWAFRRYDASRVWLSTPEILFLVGDSALRDRLSQIQKSNLYGQRGNACWKPASFVFDVTKLLIENHEVGFEVTERLKLNSTKSTPLYKRAYLSASFLQKLTNHYGRLGEREELPACVDINEIKACLGERLPIN